MIQILKLTSLCLFFLFITSCNNESPSKEEVIENTIEKDTLIDSNTTETSNDPIENEVVQEIVSEENSSLKEAIEAHAKPLAEERKLSFCDCVKKNKALTDKMMSDDASDEEFDAAMEALEKMKTGDCKIMFPEQNNMDEKALISSIFAYSPKKNKANVIAEYSTLYPETSSASASGKSKGCLLVSANIEM